jgi:REP element-mobilizing transposase RayT
MPRKPRLHVDGAFYHVILRGNHREQIFFRPADRDLFSSLVGEMIERFRMRVHAHCWMSNHVHLLMQVSDVPLGQAMMRIASRFARHMQKQRPTTGHFFERRYRAILVDADEYLLELVRYIHLNPVRAGIVADPMEYAWSGHCAYLGAAAVPWLTTDFTLSLFSADLSAARAAYRRFVLAGIGIVVNRELATGNDQDSRVLGTDQFLSRLPVALPARCHLTIEQLAEHVCRPHGVDSALLASSSRAHQLSLLRTLVVHHAIRLRIATLSDLARHFRRSTSALSQSLEHHRRARPTLFTANIELTTDPNNLTT